jgi:hypothetical protein
VLTLDALRRQLERVTYRPGWSMHLYEPKFEGVWISIRAELPNAYRPDENTVINVRSAVPPMPTGQYFLEWLLWRILRIESHECREWFKVDGEPLYDPHAPDANE